MQTKFPLIQNNWLHEAFNGHDRIKTIVKDMFNAKEVVTKVRLSNWQQYKEFYESVTYGLIEIKPIGDPNHVYVSCYVSLNIDYETLSVAEYATLRDKINEL